MTLFFPILLPMKRYGSLEIPDGLNKRDLELIELQIKSALDIVRQVAMVDAPTVPAPVTDTASTCNKCDGIGTWREKTELGGINHICAFCNGTGKVSRESAPIVGDK